MEVDKSLPFANTCSTSSAIVKIKLCLVGFHPKERLLSATALEFDPIAPHP